MRHKATQGSTRDSQEAKGQEKAWAQSFTVSSAGKARQGRANILGLASLNDL